MAKLVWRVKLVAELQPGVTTETEVARIERDEEANLAEPGLRLEEAKQLTAALQAQMVPAQVTVLSECRRSCMACGSTLAGKGHYRGYSLSGPPGDRAWAGGPSPACPVMTHR